MTTLMSRRIHDWLANGEVGLSSKTMAMTMLGAKERVPHHPLDPDDLRRCLAFLRHVPEAQGCLDAMRLVSKEWDCLVEHWSETVKTFWEEAEVGNLAPRTYNMMRRCRGQPVADDPVNIS